ncbi:MAG: hypothetical protein WB566_20210 [Terriglobales bacterium]
MVKKSIAAALLTVMVVWAEMALAPMLAMHAWPSHSASEIHEFATADYAMAAGHPCCPGISKTEDAAAPIEFAANGLPCQNEHRCCFLRAPYNVPAPANTGRRILREIAPLEIAEFSPARAESFVSPTTAAAPGPPDGLLNMVLRV